MKLKSYISKKGTEKESIVYCLETFNEETGLGIPDSYIMELEFKFPPKYFAESKKGSAICIWHNIPAECRDYLNEYQNLQLSFPNSIAKTFSANMKGKLGIIIVKEFTNKEGEKVKYLAMEIKDKYVPQGIQKPLTQNIRSEDNIMVSDNFSQCKTPNEIIQYFVSRPNEFQRYVVSKIYGYANPDDFLVKINTLAWVHNLDKGIQKSIYYNIYSQLYDWLESNTI